MSSWINKPIKFTLKHVSWQLRVPEIFHANKFTLSKQIWVKHRTWEVLTNSVPCIRNIWFWKPLPVLLSTGKISIILIIAFNIKYIYSMKEICQILICSISSKIWVVNNKIVVSWYMTPHDVVDWYQNFEATCCLHDGGNRFLWNTGTYLPDHTTSPNRS